MNFFLAGVVLVFGCVGCDGVDDDGAVAADFGDGGPIQARDGQWNGFGLNGFGLNGFGLNGFGLNGFGLNGPKLYGANGVDYIQLTEVRDPDYYTTTNVTVVGGNLKVAGSGGTGAEMSYFKYSVKEGGSTTTRRIWLNYAYPTSQSDVWEYQLQLSTDNGYSWPNLCGSAYARAVVLRDVWDPNTGAKITPRPADATTFACNNGALAKCVHFGYRPWATQNGTALADHHQACTRMVRADYCGTGTAHTVDGVRIHILDQLGIQNVDPDEDYVVEAEWGPNGAVCLNPNNTRLANQTIGCSIPTCGASFASGGLIQSGKIVP